MTNARLLAFLITVALLASLRSSFAQNVTLAWDPSTDPAVASYNLYYGGASQVYTNVVATRANTAVTVSNLTAGATYFFAVTIVDITGLESGFSGEVMYQVPQSQSHVLMANLHQTYDGTPKIATVMTIPPGVGVSLTYNGQLNPPSDAGSYQVVATIIDPNYFGNSTNTLTISKAVAIIQMASLNPTYNGTPQPVIATTLPPGLTHTLTYSGSTSAPSAAGAYQVIGTINDPNYVGILTNTLTISKALTAVQLANLDQIYDGTPKSAAATTLTGLGISTTYDGLAAVPIHAGVYQVDASIVDANYTGDATGLLTIEKAVGTVQLSNLNQTYDGAPNRADFTTGPVTIPVVVTYNGLPDPPTNAGTYAVSATIIDATDYSGGATDVLTVAKATAGVELSGLTQSFDGTSKTATALTTPSNLDVTITYNGLTTTPAAPGTYSLNATVVDDNYAGVATNLFVISPPDGPTLLLSWPLLTNDVSISQSTDLVTWTPLTTIPGPSSSCLVLEQPGWSFFTATQSATGGTNRFPVPIRIGQPQ